MTRERLGRREALAGCALVGGVVGLGLSTRGRSAPPPVDGSWPLGRGDAANTGVATGSGPDGPVSARWRFEEHLVARKPPVVADGRCYVGTHEDGPAFVALDAATGDQVWRTTLPRGVGFPDVAGAVTDDVVLGGFDQVLLGVDPSTGERRWRQRLGEQVRAPVVADGTAYVAVGDAGTVVALDPSSGEVDWRQSVGEWTPAGVGVSDGTVYAVATDEETGSLVALDADSGERRWTREFEAKLTSRPAVADGTVYLTAAAGLHAVSDDGEPRFAVEFRTAEEAGIRYARGGSAPAVADGTVYVGAPDGHVHAVDAASGEREWSFRTWNSVSGDPVVADGTVYVGSDDSFVYALDAADGTRRWEFDTGGRIDGAGGAVVDGLLYVATWEDGLYALEGR